MLETLHISNYALIDKIDITFHPGLNIITGETGAGKSIMLGALSLIMGGRADTRAVSSADRKAVVEATFTVDDHPRLKQWCEANDLDWDDSRAILRREIAPGGRSRAFVNDSPVPVATLREVAIQLVDIHSQHQNLLLSRPEFQTDVIDTLADNSLLLEQHHARWNAFKAAMIKLKAARQRVRKSREDEEYTRYQLDQLDDLRITGPDEQSELEQRREILENVTTLKQSLAQALDSLTSGRANAIDLVEEARTACDELESVLDESDNIGERLESAAIELKDIADTLAGIDDELAADPDELVEIEKRLDAIYTLEQKHHVGSLAELIELRETLRSRLTELDDSDMTLAELEKDARRAQALAKESAASLTESRKKAAIRFGEELQEVARPLGMHNLRCEVAVESADLGPTGADSITFMFAFNKNQPLMPVGNAASGGEISRLMLSIKSIIATRMELPSIIFDEVDTGVSGDVAGRMGTMMARIGESLQVIAITHLPQVAAMGGHHFKVYKQDDDTSTHTRITPLDEQERVGELALMLSGDSQDSSARATAEALLARRNS